MGSLTGCLAKAGKNVSRADKDAIMARAKALRDDGTAAADAARLAVDEQIALVTRLMAQPDAAEQAEPVPVSSPEPEKTTPAAAVGSSPAPAERTGPSLQEKVERQAPDDAVVETAGDPEAEGERKFYVTMIRGDRVARLAGPFDNKDDAEAMKSRAQDEANTADPRSAFDAFGVSAVTSKDHKPGTLNERLGIGADTPVAQEAPEPEAPAAQSTTPSAALGADTATVKDSLTPATPGKLDNFGEKLPPARRAMAAKLDEDLADDDIANRPLSEIWPLAENDAIEDTFAAAVAHAARAEVPAKPRQPYKLKRWVEKVKGVRGLTAHVLSGRLTRERLIEEVKGPRASLRDWASKVLLLEQLPREQWKRVGEVEERPEAFTYADGQPLPRPLLRLTVDDKAHYLTGDGTVAGSMAEIRALLEPAAPEKRMEFEVRGPNGGPYNINKKGDGQYRSLGRYATTSEARDAIAEYNGLVAAWEAVKASDNITERDLRSAENRPRAGKDWREGRDVTPEQFQERFGFKGGEFGKWVQQGKGDKERQALLNGAYDALMDLSQIAGIPPRAISLNGTLGIAFGSRGNGWASAHFEPSNLVINLTKTRGAGALAHEWFHAADNYFSRMRRDGQEAKFTGSQVEYRAENFITHKPESLMVPKTATRYLPPMTRTRLEAEHERRKNQTDAYNPENWQPDPKHPQGVRPEVEQRFADLVQALNDSPMTKRAMLLDGNKTGNGYWSQTLERAARAFESYVIARMHEDGYHNDFLVNVRKSNETGKAGDRYPYLLPGEIKPVADAFGALFDTIQTRTDDGGNVAMFSRFDPTRRKVVMGAAAAIASGASAADIKMGKAKPIGADVLLQQVSPEVAKILTGNGATNIQGAQALRKALLLMATTGPAEVRKLALDVSRLLPDSGMMLTVDTKSLMNAHGVVQMNPLVHMTLFTAEGRQGLTYSTVLHEALHAAVAARYHTLNTGGIRANDLVMGAKTPAAAPEMAQFIDVWREFRDGVRGQTFADKDLQLAVDQSVSPDEFFVRALTDPALQAYLSTKEYRGKTLWARFKDWIKTGLFGFGKSGTAPSWLDAALAASDEFMAAMVKDPADFERLRATFKGGGSASAKSEMQSVAQTIDTALRDAIPPGVQDWITDRTVSQRGFNRVWHRTVGTQLHKAKINKDFGRVYNAVQDFMKDVSRIATLAAEKAPDMLPQVETLGDLAKLAPTLVSPAAYKQRKANIKAASDAMFDGTLRFKRDEDGAAARVDPGSDELGGLVWTDAELRERGVSERGIKMYRQSRAAIDQSLDNMLAADLYRQVSVMNPEMVSANETEYAALLADLRRAAASDAPMDAIQQIRSAIAERLDGIQISLDGQPNQHTIDLMQRRQDLRQLQTVISDKVQRIQDLKTNGYAPLMRFGPYAVDVVGDDGRRMFFGLYESQAAANKAARNFRGDGVIVSQSVVPQKDFEALQGVSPETAMLFAEMLGVEKNEAMQAWLKNAVAEQSALKRHIRRKGVEGFDEDGSRVLAAFLTSNARAASRALHSQRITDSVESVQQGDVKDEARALADYVNNPKEEAQAIRSLLFIQYIGGSIASAIVNLTQTLVQTLPYLSQYGGAVKAGTRISAAMKLALAGKIPDPKLAAAVERAEKDGVIKPQEVFQLQAEASRSLGSNLYARSLLAAWGSMFQLAEQFNRRVAFIAAYNTATQQGLGDPFKFAENAVDETQSVFNKGNRPSWSRGAVGATLFTFKTFTIQYIEFLKRLATAGEPGSVERRQGQKAAALALVMLILLSGMKGLPFADDADDLIDTVAQALGYNWINDAQRDRWLDSILGEVFSDIVQHGMSGIPGVPFDVSQRLGMANLLPGTGLLKRSETRKQDQVLEVFGVAGSAVRDATQGEFRPLAIRNLAKGIDTYQNEMYRDTRGRKVTEADAVDAVLKAIGLQPNKVARAQREIGRQIQQRSLYQSVKEEITDAWAQARFENDADGAQQAQQALQRWNESNPDARIVIRPETISGRVRQMRLSKAQRTIANAPRPLRAQTAEALQ